MYRKWCLGKGIFQKFFFFFIPIRYCWFKINNRGEERGIEIEGMGYLCPGGGNRCDLKIQIQKLRFERKIIQR